MKITKYLTKSSDILDSSQLSSAISSFEKETNSEIVFRLLDTGQLKIIHSSRGKRALLKAQQCPTPIAFPFYDDNESIHSMISSENRPSSDAPRCNPDVMKFGPAIHPLPPSYHTYGFHMMASGMIGCGVLEVGLSRCWRVSSSAALWLWFATLDLCR